MSAQKKFTTSRQFGIMVDFMENHTDVVTGCLSSTTTKDSLSDNWSELSTLLNSEGPPTRDADSWKKVWADLKKKIKKKMRRIQMDIHGTGGGKRTVFLTALEERVVQLASMTESVIGLPGLDAGHEPEEQVTVERETSHQPQETVHETVQGTVPTVTTPTPQTTTINRRQRRRVTATSRLFEELRTQGKNNEAQAKKQVEFQTELINLIKETNLTNSKRLMVEERRLAVEEKRLSRLGGRKVEVENEK